MGVLKSVEKIGGLVFAFRQLTFEEVKLFAGPLRFQVYCYECNFIREEDYPDGIELDEYDEIAVHFGIFIEEFLVGYMRLIPLFGKRSAPIENYLSADIKEKIRASGRGVEISRLVISKGFRQRIGDKLYYEIDSYIEGNKKRDNRRFRPMVFGLYKLAYRFSKQNGIDWWAALMEPSLHKLLSKVGVDFEKVGPEVDCMGIVYPYLLYLPDAEVSVKNKYPEFYNYFIS